MNDCRGMLDAYREGGDRAALSYVSRLMVSEGVARVMNELYREVGSRYARDAYNESIKQKAFDTLLDWFKEIMNYIGVEFYNKGVLRITETTRNILTNILDKAITGGWGYEETAKYFYEVIPGINRNRASMIARTESGKAIHAGTYVGADKSPWEKQKEWISSHNFRTRGNPLNGLHDESDHYSMDGQIVDFGDKFYDKRANEFLLHPHDPKASAKCIINCRCTVAFLNKRDANGRLIRKQNAAVLR